jgi:uncharacterized membrane protein
MALHRYQRDELEFARAVTFFDAIFAFAVTLLITTVDDFSPEAWSSVSALMEANGPSLLAFTISFVVVVSFWRANHRTVTGFVALDNRAILLNCSVMFGIVLVPFATEALGKLTLPLPVAVYAVVISVTYLLQFAVEFDADRRGLRSPRMTPHERRWMLINAIPLPLVFLGSVPVAYLASPGWAQRCWIILAVVYPLLGVLERAVTQPAIASTSNPQQNGSP